MTDVFPREANSATEKSINLMRRYTEYFPRDHLLPDQLKHATNHYMLLNVSRGNVLEDAFDQLWQRRKDELKRPLRVRLGEIEEYEVGHDLGGVQVEFFNLVCKEAFSLEARKSALNLSTLLSSVKVEYIPVSRKVAPASLTQSRAWSPPTFQRQYTAETFQFGRDYESVSKAS